MTIYIQENRIFSFLRSLTHLFRNYEPRTHVIETPIEEQIEHAVGHPVDLVVMSDMVLIQPNVCLSQLMLTKEELEAILADMNTPA